MGSSYNGEDIREFFNAAKDLALEGGKILKAAYNTNVETTSKGRFADLVTKYDKEIEDLLIRGLTKKFPDHKFIAEETAFLEKSTLELTDAPTWLIDPIDGTLNFVHGFPESCISIGLTICKELVAGIIYNPAHEELYTAIKNEGAFLNGKRICVSKSTELDHSLVVLEPWTLKFEKIRDIALGRTESFCLKAQGIRSIGSAALALAYISRGTVDAYVMSGLKPWDVAAGVLLIREAGGIVIGTKGVDFDLMNPVITAASTQELTDEITQLIVETDLKVQRSRLKKS